MLLTSFRVSLQCYLAALENRDAPPAPKVYSKASKVQPPPAPTGDLSDATPAAAPAPAPAAGSVPPPPAPPPALLVPPAEEPDDEEEFEEEELQCKVIYDFQGNTLLHLFSRFNFFCLRTVCNDLDTSYLLEFVEFSLSTIDSWRCSLFKLP